MGLWYQKDSVFELTAFSDADHVGCIDTHNSTSGEIQFLGDKLISWMSKKHDCTTMSLAEAEYVTLSISCAQVMWMRIQLQDYSFNYNKIPLYCDSQSAITISCNPVQHFRTKHIHTRYHFIKVSVSCQTNWYEMFDSSRTGERANKSLGEGIKARLDERRKDWIKELPHVLWAHCTMIKSINGDMPFSLTYGTKAVIPAEIGMPTIRTEEVDIVQNDEALEINLDLLEERREQAAIREAKSKEKMEKYYSSKVHNTSFKPGDLMYRRKEANYAKESGKLGPKREGPYEVMEALGNGAYKLRDCNGNLLL
ncbi:reverse transcriptase domain-containing protein [Tanacetum coccineum]|uniref:Reverse transcriptase domain-containing protein n=1 Tax=Tanacetum coccineum TaxID=301880 RepID=A0ABQ5GWU0_9ASTR